MPGVVHVESESIVAPPPRNRLRNPFFEFFGEPQQHPRGRRSGTGSGVIIDAGKGHIITNHHVIAGADSIMVGLSDGRRYKATILGTDPETDVAILKIDADNLTSLKIGNSEKLRVGETVFAIGSPFGLSQSVTSGIVSALGRSGLGIESYEDFIQTDAAINKGNSGGALINARGELIGINTAILGATNAGGNIGIGFAIPINMVVAITEQLLETGRVQRGQLGIIVQVLTPELAKAFGVDKRRGIIIAQVHEDSPAEKAGLQTGDIILSINDKRIENHRQVKSFIGLRQVGERVVVGVLRDGKELKLEATIEAREMREMPGENLGVRFSGVLLENFVSRRDDGMDGVGVKNIRRGSRAYQRGLRPGDVILSVNDQRVTNLKELSEELEKHDKDDTLALLVNRRGRSIYIAL